MAAVEHTGEKTLIAAVDVPPALPMEGDQVGTYRLLQMLGSGGMGSVFLAEHLSIGRKVAIKFLLPELSRYPDIVGRFFDEARSVNRINHENIVEIFDFVRDPSGLSYLVMELLDGTDLYQTRKRDGPYPLARMLVVSEQIASALAGAHKVGIIHRDLKPENVFLIKKRKDGEFVKLLDFGLAKLSEDLPIARLPTQAGIVMGTPGYMSPEQATGAHVDGRSDIYSLGALMHWLLVDKVPDEADTPEAPEQNLLGDDVPDQLRALITRCGRHDPAERPSDMDEVLELLTDLRRQVRGTEVLHVMRRTEGRPASPVVSGRSIPEVTDIGDQPLPTVAPSARGRWQLLLVALGGAAAALLAVGLVALVLGHKSAQAGPAPKTEAAESGDGPAAPATVLPELPLPPAAAPVAPPAPPPAAAAAPALPRPHRGTVAPPSGPMHRDSHHHGVGHRGSDGE